MVWGRRGGVCPEGGVSRQMATAAVGPYPTGMLCRNQARTMTSKLTRSRCVHEH